MESDLIKHREMVIQTERQDGARIKQFALPLKATDFIFSVDRPAPRCGEHTNEILRAIGYGVDDIASFRSLRVVG
jgi:crotonobetainyl-CoA:carnitine CoA-transferase CaiB-like acyl-CoA transferase